MVSSPDSAPNRIIDPLRLRCGVELRNRLAKSAMSEALGTLDNRVTQGLVRLYERWASSGIGLLMTGNVMIDRRALGEPGNVVLEDGRDLAALGEWAGSATKQGVQIWMQLNHPGKQSPKGLNRENVSPSAVPFAKKLAPYFTTPRALTGAEIEGVIRRFGQSARIAKEAGFTGVQVHGAHGYLVSQFLSPHHNRRDDEWGGTPEKRRAFALAVYREIRRSVGPGFPVSIKLNSADFQRGGFSEEESLDTIAALSEVGMDLIEISGGTYEAPAMTGVRQKAATNAREAYFLEFAEQVRAVVRTPLMVTGGFRSYAGMNAALTSRAVDVIGLARPLALDPSLPSLLLRGEDGPQRVHPITTGIRVVDRAALMEVAWYTRQLERIASGREPKPNESALFALLATVARSGWGTFRTRRLRA